jgi:hypothetical protein
MMDSIDFTDLITPSDIFMLKKILHSLKNR